MRKDFLPFHKPHISEDEIEAVVRTLRSGWLTAGPQVDLFEERFAAFVGASHASAVSSGTAALHLSLDAIGIEEGDEVLVPTMTFAATGEVVIYLRARPVLVDCRPDTFNMDLDHIDNAITPRTKAIMPVHIGGQPCDMDRILDIAKHYQLKVIEDAAHAIPARHREKAIGTIGDLTCFSFYATKTITTGEGGMITTSNPEYAERMRIMRLHGISKNTWHRHSRDGAWHYEILHPGFKYNMTDMAAAMGVCQLEKCNRLWTIRQRYAMLYNEAFECLPEITVPHVSSDVQHAWHLYLIQLDLDLLAVDRNRFVDLLGKRNIGASVHFIPLHLHPYYQKTFGYRPEDFPNASAVYERIVSLPIYPSMSEADVADVIEGVRSIVQRHRR